MSQETKAESARPETIPSLKRIQNIFYNKKLSHLHNNFNQLDLKIRNNSDFLSIKHFLSANPKKK